MQLNPQTAALPSPPTGAVYATKLERVTWDAQVLVANQPAIMASLRAAGLPLANTADTAEDESGQSQLVCVAEVREDMIHALVATPSGLIYRFEPTIFELSFWSFAARNYYWVTFCMADREKASKLTGVPLKMIKGKTLSRSKSGLSGMALDALLGDLGFVSQERSDLFNGEAVSRE